MSTIENKGYAHPDALVDVDWVEAHRNDGSIKLVEVDVDTNAYSEGHIPGAVSWNWTSQLSDNVRRDILSKDALEELLGKSGISNDDFIVLYGDNNNWFAAFALWILKMYGHEKVVLMDGGRKKWVADSRELTTQEENPTPATYTAKDLDSSLRSNVREVLDIVESGNYQLVDVRSPAEFSGEVIAPPGMTETAQRAGHVPGAKSIPWALTVEEDGTFKDADKLRELYGSRGISFEKPIVAYCRIGERSSHTWFVLTYLLGQQGAKNYDGSWTEYGSMVGVPIEK
ncbi:putative thiosulfate sulfurtransferase [Abditibacteriota bacterium]|nr:putative thiosulfate sulfurtransferase [Abditibacteriota bacterium]